MKSLLIFDLIFILIVSLINHVQPEFLTVAKGSKQFTLDCEFNENNTLIWMKDGDKLHHDYHYIHFKIPSIIIFDPNSNRDKGQF